MPDNLPAKLPAELREAIEKVAPWLQSIGMPVPQEFANAVPQLNIKERVYVLAHSLGQNLRGTGLYLAGDELVTVNEGSGEFKLMTPRRAVSWVDQHVTFYKQQGEYKTFVSAPRAKLEEILASDAFLCKVPPLKGINPVKLPVRRRSGALELLQPGYDAESGIYTLHTGLDYDETREPDEARAWLWEVLKYFPFADRRSLAAQLSAMLTVYCMGMLPPTARPPMFVWNANQVGSGKTRLAEMCLIPVFGTANPSTWWQRNEDMKKELDSAAQNFLPYLLFDDRSGKLYSNILNAWVTATRWAGRVMGTKERFAVPLRAITMVTGNNLTYSDDISRRSEFIDLFQPLPWDQRKLPDDAIPITTAWLTRDEVRANFLSACYALLRHSEERQKSRPVTLSRTVASFEIWSETVPPVVVHAVFGDPTEMPPASQTHPLLQDARDLARRALDQFIDGKETGTVKLSQMVPIARRHGLFVEILGALDDIHRELDAGKGKWKQIEDDDGIKRDATSDEKWEQAAAWVDRPMVTSFGTLMRKLMMGLLFADSEGRWYQFGVREGSRHATYVCTRKGNEALVG